MLRRALGRLGRLLSWVATILILLFTLVLFEASFGHDGLLCELGIAIEDENTSGCGDFWR